MFVTWKLLAVIAAAFLSTGCIHQSQPEPKHELQSGARPEGQQEPQEQQEQPRPEAQHEPAFEGPYQVLASKLRTPWAIAFHGESIYISEREGSIVQVERDGTHTRKPAKLKHDMYASGEAGFLGLVLHPDFEATGEAFAYHTYRENGRILNRIVRIAEEASEWREEAVLLEGIPGGRIHDGGRLAIGPDGFLYATTGEAGDEPLAQQLDTTAGKTLRLTLDGRIPEDNPYPDSYIYSYGHRNPQGLAWDSSGVLYSSEHGPSGCPGGHDELNIIEPGANYGWPQIFGDAKAEGMISPIYHTGDPAIAPSGIAFGEDGALLIATLRGQTLYRFDPKSMGIEPLLEGEGRLRDVAVRDGFIYVITNNTDGRGTPGAEDDRLLRLPASRP